MRFKTSLGSIIVYSFLPAKEQTAQPRLKVLLIQKLLNGINDITVFLLTVAIPCILNLTSTLPYHLYGTIQGCGDNIRIEKGI